MNAQARNPHLSNTLIGFDRFLNTVNEIANSGSGNYPPYNILKIDETTYRISIAAAGFSIDDVEITHHGDRLVVKGERPADDEEKTYLHRGISTRSFTRTFVLSENTRPKEAEFENGLLHIDLEHVVPEERKPRKVKIKTH